VRLCGKLDALDKLLVRLHARRHKARLSMKNHHLACASVAGFVVLDCLGHDKLMLSSLLLECQGQVPRAICGTLEHWLDVHFSAVASCRTRSMVNAPAWCLVADG